MDGVQDQVTEGQFTLCDFPNKEKEKRKVDITEILRIIF